MQRKVFLKTNRIANKTRKNSYILMRLMSLDYGERRIGIALSDPEQLITFPYRTIDTKKTPDVVKEIVLIIKDQAVGALIVGNPLSANNTDTKKSKQIKKFVAMLSNHVSIPITLWDESYTTRSAIELMNQAHKKLKKNRDKVDQLAASLILKDYLEHRDD